MREDEVYRACKSWFASHDFKILAGQPPRGTDRIPVVEIKPGTGAVRGSSGSHKPDLIVANCDVVLIVECKPAFDQGDVDKLHQLRDDLRRQESLAVELRQRRLLERRDLASNYADDSAIIRAIRLMVSYAGVPEWSPGLYSLVFEDEGGSDPVLYWESEQVLKVT